MEPLSDSNSARLQADNSNDAHKLAQAADKNESGIDEDMHIESVEEASECTSMDLNHSSDTGNVSNNATPICGPNSASGGTENSFGFGNMKKDDSGIYSERSPNITSTKEGSDGELSESMSESLDDNQCVVNFQQEAVADTDCGAVKTKAPDTGECDISANNSNVHQDASNAKQTETTQTFSEKKTAKVQESDSSMTDSKTCDSILEKDEEMPLSSTKDTICDDSDSDKQKSEGGSKNSSEEEGGSQNEDETWADFMKKVSRGKKSSSKRLVDYEDSDSNSEQAESSATTKVHRHYRKRKQDSDDAGEGTTADDADEAGEDGEEDATPVLLRHNPLLDSPHDLDSLDHDSSTDSSTHEAEEVKESSESEDDGTPMDISQFGPPKHKWRALFDLRHREFGYSTACPPGHFMRKVQGSLQMVRRFELQFKMDHHEGCVNALHFNKNGTLLASGSDDLNIVVWDWIRNRPALVYDSGHRSNVFQSKFMPYSGDCHIVSCARDGQVRLAYLSSTGVCKSTKKIAQHKGAAHKLALEMDSPHIFLSCGEDAITYEIDVREEKPRKLVTTKQNDKKVAMYSIHSNPVNSYEFCLGGRDHFIRVYDKRKIQEDVNDGVLKKFVPHHIASTEKENMKANVTCACYNYNGTEILGTYNDEDIYLFSNLHSDEADYVHRYRGHRNNQTVKGVNFYGPHSEFVVSGSDCGHIFLWDKATENIVQHLEGDDGGVINVLEPHPHAPVLATSGLDHDVKIWAPTAENPTDLKGLRKMTKRNKKERDEERTSDGGMIEGSMLWFIMNQLRRGRRRRERESRAARGDDDDDDSDTVSDEDLTSQEDSDSEGGPVERIHCNPS